MKIATLNIYGGAHTNAAIKKLAGEEIETLCVQEVHEADLEKLKTRLNLPNACFCPMWDVRQENPYGFRKGKMGIAILTNHPATFQAEHYVGTPQNVPEFDTQDPNKSDRVLLTAEIDHPQEGKLLVATTHFTWTPDGKGSPDQRRDVAKLLILLKEKENLIFCGDLNAPRGGEIFLRFSNLFVDQIPPEVQTTIDPNLHRKSGLKLIVDAILTSNNLKTKNFTSIDGVSDHIALITSIQKKIKTHPEPKGPDFC